VRDLVNGRSTPRREQAFFGVGGLLIFIHTVDDSIALGEIDIAPAVIAVIALMVAALYTALPWFIVVVAALFVGFTRLAGGVLHLVSLGDPSPGDYTGPLEALGALCVLADAVVMRQLALRRSAEA